MSPHPSCQPHHHFWWEIPIINAIKWFPNSTPRRGKNNNPKPSHENKKRTNTNGNAYEWKKCFCEVWLRAELKEWSSHLLDNLSDCLICAPGKFQVSSTRFEPTTCAVPVQCSLTNWAMKQLRREWLNLLALCGPVKGMMSERNVFVKVWLRDELKKWSLHLLVALICWKNNVLHFTLRLLRHLTIFTQIEHASYNCQKATAD